jgi:hypothetical protein
MKTPYPLVLDFCAPPRRFSLPGLALLAAGLAAAAAVSMSFREAVLERDRLEGAVETVSARHRPAAQTPARSAEQVELAKAARELAIPWTRLLSELEAASNDTASEVSLLQVEPDAEKHTVRITAEVRSLPDALLYLQRLQRCEVLAYPMLESHERRKDDPEHPVRIKIAAEWRA